MERRRYTRFDTTTSGSKLALIGRAGARLQVSECTLRDISYGGMCFHAAAALRPGDILDFLMDLKTPLQDLVLVRARVEWEGKNKGAGRVFGARFLDSSKGWLAGADDIVQ